MAKSASVRAVSTAIALDVALVVLFAAIGRASHDEGVFGTNGWGLATTAWPFLVGLALGWLVTAAWRHPTAPVRAGLWLWMTTVVVGMLLRAVSGQGTAVAFIVVATMTLLVFLVGWRVLASVVTSARRRRRRA